MRESFKSCRRVCVGSPSVMEDAIGKQTESLQCDSIQETGQEQRLARMAGLSSLDLIQFSMEAERGGRIQILRRRREG
jgi:hypothetical protein